MDLHTPYRPERPLRPVRSIVRPRPDASDRAGHPPRRPTSDHEEYWPGVGSFWSPPVRCRRPLGTRSLRLLQPFRPERVRIRRTRRIGESLSLMVETAWSPDEPRSRPRFLFDRALHRGSRLAFSTLHCRRSSPSGRRTNRIETSRGGFTRHVTDRTYSHVYARRSPVGRSRKSGLVSAAGGWSYDADGRIQRGHLRDRCRWHGLVRYGRPRNGHPPRV